MTKLAHSIERDTFEWDVEVIVYEVSSVTSEWRLEVMTPEAKLSFPAMTRGQVGLFVAALRRAVLVASVKVNPLVDGEDDGI